MRVVCVWREEEEYSRMVREWLREFERRTGREIESLDPHTREGEGFCQAYDVVEYPTFLALDSKGGVMEIWRGKMLPTFDEVNYWAMQQ